MKVALNRKPQGSNEQRKTLNLISTGLPKELLEDVEKFARIFKGKVYKEFSENITHVIVYPNPAQRAKRTMKYLNGLIQGCWIVTYRCKYTTSLFSMFLLSLVFFFSYTNFFLLGIQESIIRNELLDEQSYEVTEDGYGIGAPEYCRLKVKDITLRQQ